MDLKTKITRFHYRRIARLPVFVKPLLKISSYFYDAVTILRNFFYDKGILKTIKVDANVISVGNITTGGVGKNPVVAQIADYYASFPEKKVCIISKIINLH